MYQAPPIHATVLADYATRGIKTENIEKRRFSPPPLLLPPSLKTNVGTSCEVSSSLNFEKYSTWTRLLSVVAKLYQGFLNFKDRAKTAIKLSFSRRLEIIFLVVHKRPRSLNSSKR